MKYCLVFVLLHVAFGGKVKVLMHSDEDDSRIDDDDSYTITKRTDATLMPFVKKYRKHVDENDEDEKVTEKSHLHPNDLFFPLIYMQNHINSMFKFGEIWYTWSIDERKDGSKVTNYYACYDEPRHCDETGWDRVNSPPKCAFQIDSLMGEDRACVNTFGIEPHNNGNCDSGEPIKVNDIVKSCGARIRSLWRFVRAGRRPSSAAKPADINSLVCEDEKECHIAIEYKIHHDRITFSLSEPNRGQTFKSALIRDVPLDDDKITPIPGHRHPRVIKKLYKESYPRPNKKYHKKNAEGKGVVKEEKESFPKVNEHRNKIKVRDDVYSDEGQY
ncbi:uncharacterized protein LOC121738620 [Aricia agestis]|uniref:uncharacterized protein LOC121738620 n=1 Tax=Aricia agestis TaxID=91739 RepID=UPI001C20AB74|nr:uncharacterized protein LOC121738620 [Aricia agestis]XP_041986730.1 uncharacterized protein LOC121738620 [Aricia agestis]